MNEKIAHTNTSFYTKQLLYNHFFFFVASTHSEIFQCTQLNETACILYNYINM